MPASAESRSFEATVLPHLDAAHNLARWLMRDAAAAEDVLQEALLRSLTYFASFKGVNPRAWLLQIVRHAAYDSIKLNRGIRLLPFADSPDDPAAEAIELTDQADDPEQSLLKARERCWLRSLVAELPVELREALVLRELEELPYKEIAQVTGVPIGTVMSRLWRARRRLMEAAAEAETKE